MGWTVGLSSNVFPGTDSRFCFIVVFEDFFSFFLYFFVCFDSCVCVNGILGENLEPFTALSALSPAVEEWTF